MAEHETDDDYPADTIATLEALAKAPPRADECLAGEALRKVLTTKASRRIERGPHVLIITVPSAEWVGPVAKALPRLVRSVIVQEATERNTVSKVEVPVGASSLYHLQRGRSVAFISQDPESILDPAVMAAADLFLTVLPPSVNMLRKVVRLVSGSVARGITSEMTDLSFYAVVTAIRPGLSARDCVANLKRAIAPPVEPPASTVPLLQTLPLTQAIRRWAGDTLADLDAVAAGDLSADALMFGVLEGPPGTGKTLLVRSLAATSGWTFVPTSVGTWFTTQDGALGGVARNLKRFIDEILKSEPAIGFLDELDALPDRAALDARGLDWWAPVITLFLTEIDRLRSSGKRVLLLGATNFFDRLDDALVRPGRLQQRISVRAPETREEIAALFRFHLGDDLADADLMPLGQLGQGATPAMVEGWVRSARATARSAKRALTSKDVLAQILPKDDRTPADIEAIALHEAGHALVAYRLGHQVDLVSIVPQGTAAGHVSSQLQTMVPTITDVHNVVTVMLAGRAADIVLGKGPNAGAMSDLEQATKFLLAARDKQGLGHSLIYGPALGIRPDAATIAAVAGDLDTLLARAIEMIETESGLASKLASHLVRTKMLTRDELSRLLDPNVSIPEPIDPKGDIGCPVAPAEVAEWRV